VLPSHGNAGCAGIISCFLVMCYLDLVIRFGLQIHIEDH
jgi:hypothetical protein